MRASYTAPGVEHADLRVAYRLATRPEGRFWAAVGVALDWLFWRHTGRYADGVPVYTYRQRRVGGWR